MEYGVWTMSKGQYIGHYNGLHSISFFHEQRFHARKLQKQVIWMIASEVSWNFVGFQCEVLSC